MIGQSADKTEIRAEQSSCSIIGTRVLFSPLLLFMNICVGHVAHAILATSVCASRGEFQDFLQPVGENPPMRRVEDGSTSATIGGRSNKMQHAPREMEEAEIDGNKNRTRKPGKKAEQPWSKKQAKNGASRAKNDRRIRDGTGPGGVEKGGGLPVGLNAAIDAAIKEAAIGSWTKAREDLQRRVNLAVTLQVHNLSFIPAADVSQTCENLYSSEEKARQRILCFWRHGEMFVDRKSDICKLAFPHRFFMLAKMLYLIQKKTSQNPRFRRRNTRAHVDFHAHVRL